MKNFIYQKDNTVPKEVCDVLITMFDRYESLGLTRNRVQNNQPKTTADDDSVCITTAAKLSNFEPQLFDPIVNAITDAFNEYRQEYSIAFDAANPKIYLTELKLQRTGVGQGYHRWHFESSDKEVSDRILAYTLYLNDVDEGGETEFLYQGVRVKAVQGRVSIFPASFTHLHRGNPPLSNTKYIVTGWFEF